MSRTRIRLAQQQIIPSGTISNPIPQGNCFYRPPIYPNPGPLYYNGEEEFNYIFTIPKTSNILGVRLNEGFESTTLTGENFLRQLGITINQHQDDFPYRVRFPLVDRVQEIDDDQELRIFPTYNRFAEDLIRPPSITLNIETAVDTSIEGNNQLWVIFNSYQLDPTIDEFRSPIDSSQTPIRQVGADFSSIVSPATYENAVRVLGESLEFKFDGWDLPPQLEENIPEIFRGEPYPSKPNESILDGLTNPKTFGSVVYQYREGRTLPLLFVIRNVQYNVNLDDGTWRRVSYYDQVRTQIPLYLLTTDIKVNMYDGETRRSSVDWPIQKVEGRLSRDFRVSSKVNNIGLAVRDGLSVIRSIDTNLPHRFTNTAENAYVIKSPNELPEDRFGLYVQGPEVEVPNNAELASVTNDGNSHGHLRYVGEWDGQTFQKLRTRDPAWMIYWILTDPSFEINELPRNINLQSFYDASVYNNELVNNYPRWCFDGLLTGTTKEIITKLLTCMNGTLEKDNLGTWNLYQERPQDTSWIISPCVCNNATITNRLAVEKPNIRGSYINRFNGKSETITERSLTDAVEEFPGQEKICAERWSYWRTFIDQELLNTVEFTVPLSSNNNDGSIIDFYRMQIYDIIEVYDPDFSGQRASGRILESTRTYIRVDELPVDLFGSSGSVPDEFSDLRIQKKEGGIEHVKMTRVEYDPNNRKDNKIYFDDREPFDIGTTWGIKLSRFNPRKWRILSISETDQGTALRVVARFYVDKMHDFVDNFIPIVYPPLLAYLLRIDQYIWEGDCGVNIGTFRGAFGSVHYNYPVTFDEINDRMLFEWGLEPWDDHYGTMNNLEAGSCILERNTL